MESSRNVFKLIFKIRVEKRDLHCEHVMIISIFFFCSSCGPSFPTLCCKLITDSSVLASLFLLLKLRKPGRSKLPPKGQVDTGLSFKNS